MEKRKFSRTGFHTAGEIFIGEKQVDVAIEDLSLKGALISSDKELPVGTTVELRINLSNSELCISASGKLVHKEADNYGIKFSSIDAESMIHLRSLMEYNTENYDKIGSELAFLYHKDETEEN